MWQYVYTDELSHYGIKGMKWGVRRYQKKDGSLTSAGKSRYRRAADSAQRDADDLRKHGYTKEADAVQAVANKNRQKAERQAAKKLEKDQKKYDKSYRKNYFKAYNKAADYANEVLIPEINRKYAKYDFSKTDDPKIQRIYQKYINEYQDKFSEVFSMKMRDLIGDRPE